MNVECNPRIEELRALIKACNDNAGHHILWVAKNGDVHVSRVPKDKTPVGYEEATPDMQFRYETFEAGNEYVGPEAAEDNEWVHELFEAMTRGWPKAKRTPTIEYIDQF